MEDISSLNIDQGNGTQGPILGHSHQHPQPQELIQCPICSRSYEKHIIEVHAASCEGPLEDIVTIRDYPESIKVECPICNQSYDQTEIEHRAANCGEEIFM